MAFQALHVVHRRLRYLCPERNPTVWALAGEPYRNTPLFLTRERLSNQSEILKREIALVGSLCSKMYLFSSALTVVQTPKSIFESAAGGLIPVLIIPERPPNEINNA